MSVIIKGMKLPQHAAVNGEKDTAYKCVILAHPDNSVELVIDTKFASAYDNGHNIQRYPITEIPTPHGRLIDCESDFFPTAFRHNSTDYARGWNACLRSVLLSSTIIEAEVNNEQRTKYAICRPYDGITLNTEVEFLLDHNGDVMLFDSESAAWEYFKPIGITEEEPNAIKVVEYKERENNAGRNDT